LGLYNRPEVAAVPGDVSPTPLIIIIIIICCMQPEAEIACIGPILFFTVTDRWDMNFYIIGSRGEGVSNAAMKNLCHLKLQLQLIVTRAITASKISVLSFLPVSYDVGVLI
jgi:hypothetical protein